MEIDLDNIAKRGGNVVSLLREHREDRWKQLAQQTVLTEKQIAMWELAVVFEQKNVHIAREFDIHVTTVARHCERVREKRKKLQEELESIENTINYFKDTGSFDT